MSLRGAGSLLLGLAAVACGVADRPLSGTLVTLEQFVPAARAGAPLDPKRLVVLREQPIELLNSPYAAGVPALQQPGVDGLAVFPAFSEGRPAAYTITERWLQFPKVWVQPLYVFVTGFDASGQPVAAGLDNDVVFGVDTTSRFYSPYWQVYYAVAQPSPTADRYTSEKDIFDAHLPLVKGALSLCAIAPDEVGLARAQGQTNAVRPLTFEKLNSPFASKGWVDGRYVHYLAFGRNRFRVDEHGVVEETALFRFALRDPATGQDLPLDLPTVGGTGPLGQPRPPEVVNRVPQFGTHWREYLVVLNPTSVVRDPVTHEVLQPGVFVPPGSAALRQRAIELTGDERWVPPPAASVEALGPEKLAEYTLRVAANGQQCFNDPQFPNGVCSWLDSQRAIEGRIAAALIHETQHLSSCPLLLFNGVATP